MAQHGIFGEGPRLAVAASVFFGIGVMFMVVSEESENRYGDKIVSQPIESTREDPDRSAFDVAAGVAPVYVGGWVNVGFVVGVNGRTRELRVIERCVQRTNGECVDGPNQYISDCPALDRVGRNRMAGDLGDPGEQMVMFARDGSLVLP